MFDVGFAEMMLIMIVALIVVGPERLPGLARSAGLWVGKAKRFVSDVKSEIDQEIAADTLKKMLDEGQGTDSVYEIIEETKQVGRDIKQSITDAGASDHTEDASPTLNQDKKNKP